jgi:putative endonuclease
MLRERGDKEERRKEKGRKGEDTAVNSLSKRGYRILERNFRTKRGEIDIVALSPQNTLCFIEVKTRSSVEFGKGEEAVNSRKIAKITRTAESYINKRKWKGDVRFDVISVVMNKDKLERIEHIEAVT